MAKAVKKEPPAQKEQRNRSVTMTQFQKFSRDKMMSGVWEIRDPRKGKNLKKTIGIFLPWSHFRGIQSRIKNVAYHSGRAEECVKKLLAPVGT
jgi:hypothetical protein